MVQEKIKESFPSTYWLLAETSDVRINNRHCYLEFIEKNEASNSLVAKARGYIWSSTFEMLKPYFERTTGQAFVSGIKVLIKVSVEFHPVYGYSLNVWDIDPSYTLGDMQLKRQAILKQLEEEGVLRLNKELQLSELPQRIALISSPTAAGYEDFQKQLSDNSHGFTFYSHLFPAIMQGEQTEKSIIAALDKIYRNKDSFDAVAIIRGGGAASDLASFDSYLLAANCAQFPLPVIVGIGHERDETVLDFVAFHREKTPTAVAEYFIGVSRQFFEKLVSFQNVITDASIRLLEESRFHLKRMETYFPLIANNLIEKKKGNLDVLQIKLKNGCRSFLSFKESSLKEKEAFMKFSSPDYILAKGYSITLKDGKVIKSSEQLKPGDTIETILKDGRIESAILSSK
jgi:Exonuclease VII, large subunit